MHGLSGSLMWFCTPVSFTVLFFRRTFFLSTGFGESPDVGLGSALARRRSTIGIQ